MNSLEKAFQHFEQAAHSLQQQHASLHGQVEHLERKLLDSNRALEAVLEAVGSGIAVVSARGELLRANRAFDAMNLRGENRGLADAALAALVESGPAVGGSARLRLETSDGSRHLAATLIPVGDEDGTHVLTVQDITDIRREEEEGGRKRRLEALGRMAAELAHEVRNPLGSIRLFAGMLHEDLSTRDEHRAMTEQVLSAVAGVEAIVSNLLAFAAPSQGEPRRVDLAALAREACELLAPACSIRGVRLHGPDREVICPVSADPEGIRQVLLNLLGNALSATADGGRIDVAIDPGNDHVTLIVTDHGKGIPAEDLPRVFDPFFTRTEGGTGLGLSIVHGILERHGGRISLDSQAGRGTRARVELPLQLPIAAAASRAHA